MKDNYRFTDLEDKDKREEWWQKELAECAHCYRIPMYNLQLPLYFRRPPKHCVDVGTNVGTFSYYASGFFQNIYSYEAMKQTYEAAKENLQGVKNVKLHNLAVSDESDKEVKIVAHSSGLSGDSSVYNTTEDNLYEVVKTIDLDKIFVDNSIDRIDYLKVDCEGSEYQLLMNKDLSKIDFLAMELHPGYLGEEKTKELLAHLDKYFVLHYQLGEHILFYGNKEV